MTELDMIGEIINGKGLSDEAKYLALYKLAEETILPKLKPRAPTPSSSRDETGQKR